MSNIGHNNPPEDISEIEFDNAVFDDGGDPLTVSKLMGLCGDLDQYTAAQIAHLYAHIKGLFDELDATRDEMSKFIELIKNVKLPAAFDKEKIKTFTLENGTRVTKSDRTTASIIGPQREAFDWLIANGYPDAVKETVNSSTLGGIAGTILKNVEILPDGRQRAIDADIPIDLPDSLFKVTITPTTSITKGKKK